MSFSEAVVEGEAIESDDESDVEFSAPNKNSKYAAGDYHGTVFRGEAPESDDEILAFSNVRLGAAQEVTEVYKPSPKHPHREPVEGKTVLQKILIERNYLFWLHLNQMVQSTVVTSSSKILAAEELLIQSQLKLQAASHSIKQANETADQVLAKVNDILSSDFLPNINIPT